MWWITHVLRILYTFNCVLNLPYFPRCCVFSTLSPVFWLLILPLVLRDLYTFTCVSHYWYFSGVANSLHFHLCFELPILPLLLCILYTFTCVLNDPYFLLCRVSYTFNCVVNYTHTSSSVAYSLHFQLCCELPILPLAGVAYCLHFTRVLSNPYFLWCGDSLPFTYVVIYAYCLCVVIYSYLCWSTHTEVFTHVF